MCPAAALDSYLEVTKTIRAESEEKLIITHKKPYHAASSQTIACWIKDILKESGIDTSKFTARSTRHASTSAAARSGTNIEVIRKTADWTEKSKVFAQFYNRPIVEKSEIFASSIILKN